MPDTGIRIAIVLDGLAEGSTPGRSVGYIDRLKAAGSADGLGPWFRPSPLRRRGPSLPRRRHCPPSEAEQRTHRRAP